MRPIRVGEVPCKRLGGLIDAAETTAIALRPMCKMLADHVPLLVADQANSPGLSTAPLTEGAWLDVRPYSYDHAVELALGWIQAIQALIALARFRMDDTAACRA